MTVALFVRFGLDALRCLTPVFLLVLEELLEERSGTVGDALD